MRLEESTPLSTKKKLDVKLVLTVGYLIHALKNRTQVIKAKGR